MMEIRDVEPVDIDRVRRLLSRAWHATYDGLLGKSEVAKISARWHSNAQLCQDMNATGGVFLIASKDGEIIATAYALHCGDTVKLRRLYVLPEAQGLGAGTALLSAVEARFEGAHEIVLEVERGNDQAIAFYRRKAFEDIGSTSHCGGDSDVEAIIMRKPLGVHA